MSSSTELLNELNDMRHQMKSLMNFHKKTTRALLQKVNDQTERIARLEREKRFTDASFRRIYSEFSEYRTQTNFYIDELVKDLDDQKSILRNFSHIMGGDPENSDVILETNEQENSYIIDNNIDVSNSLNNYWDVVNNMHNLNNVWQTNIPSPPRLRRESVHPITAPPPAPRFIAPEGSGNSE